MLAALSSQSHYQTISKQNAKVKSITPCEKDVIKNVFGNNAEIPQIIYNRIQESLNKGKNTNAILKVKMADGSSYWTNNRFEPSINNQFKNKFTVKTKLSSEDIISKTKKLYKKLSKIEKHLSVLHANKFLNGYLEAKCISFNELVSI